MVVAAMVLLCRDAWPLSTTKPAHTRKLCWLVDVRRSIVALIDISAADPQAHAEGQNQCIFG